MSKWLILKEVIINLGYKLFQFQFNWSENDGFNAVFFHPEKESVTVITHLKEIQDDIINSNMT